MTDDDYKVLQSAKAAQALTKVMVKALETMDEDLAKSAEEIGYNLELLKVLNSKVSLPFYTDSLSDALISDYIAETNEGAKESADYVGYNPGFSLELFADGNGLPNVERLKQEANKLGVTAEDKLNKQENEHDERIAGIMKSNNSKWRDNQS
jgi:hypothetical protein